MRGLFRGRGEDDGFTLVEVLVAMTIGLVVIGGGVLMFTAAVQSQPRQSAHLASERTARSTSEEIVRELREGWSTTTATSSQLSFLTYVHSATCGGAYATTSIACRVTYTCTSGTCTRVEAQPNGTSPGPAQRLVTGLSNGTVFTYSTGSGGSTWVGVTLQFPGEDGGEGITVEDGATLRNSASAT
jgi:prepilin-type N-terminal cleavage/methylation domain-containing protein